MSRTVPASASISKASGWLCRKDLSFCVFGTLSGLLQLVPSTDSFDEPPLFFRNCFSDASHCAAPPPAQRLSLVEYCHETERDIVVPSTTAFGTGRRLALHTGVWVQQEIYSLSMQCCQSPSPPLPWAGAVVMAPLTTFAFFTG